MQTIIYTDSLSVLEELHSRKQAEPLLEHNVHTIAVATTQGRIIKFCWVPSHVGIPGNERADRCAAKARENQIVEVNLPYKYYVREIRKTLMAKKAGEMGYTGQQ